MALQFLANSNGWLSFNHSTPALYITAEDEEFDVETLRAWREEGFNVKYVPLGKGGKQYVNTLHHLGDGMSIGERYAIVGIHPSSSQALSLARVLKTEADTIIDSIRRRGCHLSRCLF